MATPAPDWIVEVAFSTDPGSGTPVWENVSRWVKSFDFSRGTNHELDQPQTATGKVVFNNEDRRFDPTYAAGPYFPNILPMRRLRIRGSFGGTTYDECYGYAEDWLQDYPDDGTIQQVTVPFSDGFLWLALPSAEGSYAEELSGTRVANILAAAAWPSSTDVITFDNLGSSANPDVAGSGTTLSNSSWAPPSSGLIILFVESNIVGTPNTPTVSGNGITWIQIATIQGITNARLTLFAADASGSTTGITTADFGGQSQSSSRMAFMHADGVDLSGGVEAAFVQAVPGTGTATSGLITLSAAGGSNNRPVSGWAVGNAAMTPRADWTEMDELSSGSASIPKLETQQRPDAFETTASVTWDGVSRAWHGIAAELKVGLAQIDLDIDAGQSTVAAVTLGSDDKALSHLLEVHAAELGLMYVARTGKFTFVDRHAFLTAPTDFIVPWGDVDGEHRYVDVQLPYGHENIYNDVRVTRTGGTEQQAEDATSKLRFGPRTLSRTVILVTDNDAADQAAYLLARFANPELRVSRMELAVMRDTFQIAQVLAGEIGNKHQFRRRHPATPSDPIQHDVYIVGIEMWADADNDTWGAAWRLAPLASESAWVLDDPDFSILDDTTRLAY
jgi:hypothetical protein